jgi:peptidylprolyl isomerase
MIWAFAGIMAIGTMGSFFLIIVANQNDQREAAEMQEMYDRLLSCQVTEVPDAIYEEPEPIEFEEGSIGDSVETEDVIVGTGREVSAADACVVVHYQGNLSDGTVFDGSYDGDPIAFTLDGVIAGWQEGLQGMKEGGQRVIKIPAELAYGAAGSPPTIGPNEPLVFTVDLIEVKE